MFKKVLIANRGEIACRIARTCQRMGIAVATVHSSADRNALHVRAIGESVEIGAPPANSSYLAIDRVVAAATQVGADAVHPGYGFLAENAAFATSLARSEITFIGPDAELLACFGNKAAAKDRAQAAGLPVVPGTPRPSDSVEEIAAAAREIGLPVLLKAAFGGGGKGMRVATSYATLRADIEAAMREGQSAFGNPSLILEQYLPEARHIEVQILGDGCGNVIHLADRECSLQRRHQKVIEEAPVTSLALPLRSAILDHAVKLGRSVKYLGLGTVEFLVQGDRVFFLEVNPRIQVEHPVTEEITGLDLVELQIRAVAERRIPIAQEQVRERGIAVEARLYAEDPANRLLPSTGLIELLQFPSTIRVDAGVDAGMEITSYYDPMIAKLVVTGQSREQAYDLLKAALEATAVVGVATNLSLLQALVAHAAVRANQIHTGTIETLVEATAHAPVLPEDAAIAAALWLWSRRAATQDVWAGQSLTGWRLAAAQPAIASRPAIRLRSREETFEVRFGEAADSSLTIAIAEHAWSVLLQGESAGRTLVSINGRMLSLATHVAAGRVGFVQAGRGVAFDVEPYLSGKLLARAGAVDGQVRAPMMGRITAVDVDVGQHVSAGDRLGLMESMKMELTLSAPIAGTISEVACIVNETVEREQRVFSISASGAFGP